MKFSYVDAVSESDKIIETDLEQRTFIVEKNTFIEHVGLTHQRAKPIWGKWIIRGEVPIFDRTPTTPQQQHPTNAPQNDGEPDSTNTEEENSDDTASKETDNPPGENQRMKEMMIERRRRKRKKKKEILTTVIILNEAGMTTPRH